MGAHVVIPRISRFTLSHGIGRDDFDPCGIHLFSDICRHEIDPLKGSAAHEG
jgi:hypothetical protein